MKFILSLFILISISIHSQSDLSVNQKLILKGIEPSGSQINSKYQSDFRVITWREDLSKFNEYTNKLPSDLGFEYIKKGIDDNQKVSYLYRNCSNKTVLEVTKWYNNYLSINLSWYKDGSVGVLMFCNNNFTTNERAIQLEEKKEQAHWDEFMSRMEIKYATPVPMEDRRNKPKLVKHFPFLFYYYHKIFKLYPDFQDIKFKYLIDKDSWLILEEDSILKTIQPIVYPKYFVAMDSIINFLEYENPAEVFKRKHHNDKTFKASTYKTDYVSVEREYVETIKVDYNALDKSISVNYTTIPNKVNNDPEAWLAYYLQNKETGKHKLSVLEVTVWLSGFKYSTIYDFKPYDKLDKNIK